MALGEIEKSKNVRSSKTGFLFFLLLQMSLLSKVWPQSTIESVTTEHNSATTVQEAATTVQEAATTEHNSATTVQEAATTVQEAATTEHNSVTTVHDSATTVHDSATTVQEAVTTVPTAGSVHPESSSSSSSTGQMSAMSTSGSTNTNTQTTSSADKTVSTMGSTNMNTDKSSSVTGNYSAMSCPVFDCTTDCYVQFMNATMKPCPPSSNFCEIMTQNTSYSVKCSASCGVSCGNSTHGNCSWKCCNTTSCLNDTLLALTSSLSTTVAATTSTTTTTTTKPTTTQANNGKKCHNIKCDGPACYKPISTSMLCPVGQDYCMLKKTTSGTMESWQAGCSEDCRKMPVCSTSVTTCYLECCNATSTASCLKLTGDVNMPSSATRGPHSPALLIASLLLFWILKVFT